MASPELRRTTVWAVVGLITVALAARWAASLPQAATGAKGGGHTWTGGSRSANPSGDGASSRGSTSAGHTELMVHVAGSVRRPGVYRLAPGSRTYQALLAAGGATREGDANALSLAAPIADGSRVFVPTKAGSGASRVSGTGAGSASDPHSGPVSLAAATVDQLDGLDGIGPALARRIVEWRDTHGGFGTVDDLDAVPGIGPAKLAALKGAVVP